MNKKIKIIILDSLNGDLFDSPAFRITLFALKKCYLKNHLIGEIVGYIKDEKILKEVQKLIGYFPNYSNKKIRLNNKEHILLVSFKTYNRKKVLQFWIVQFDYLPLLDLSSEFFDEN